MPTPPVDPIRRLADLDLVLRTPRLLLRPLAVSDVEALWPWVSDPDLPKMMTWSPHRDRAETKAFLRQITKALERERSVGWAITLDGRVSGVIGLDDVAWELRAWRVDRAELGYWVAPPLWGRGICTEAARAVVELGFGPLGLHKITVGCLVGNDASRRVIEKLGFRFLVVRKDHCFHRGRWWDHRDYELTVDEWNEGRGRS